ncbi:ATP-dependent DNA helicase 2 subunit 1 isoform X1 [Drosophila takahashii]|uniref:ATP-dependent DNA helicase 2 subunit 1 isoform X1 n=1 Tax=Drosophila takahashii TaxID=29030 RepID=UPI001CF91C8E|nr:ATP-dependent DNA helicase 2 subunit 1 [Drosophila takahashii]
MSTWNPENDVDLLSGSEDEEEVAMKRDYHGREALLFVVDANLQTAGVERLMEALNIIRTAFISGILVNDKDLIGLIFANTKHSPPPLESNALDSIVMPQDCAVFLPLRQLTKPIVEHYLEFMGGVETQFAQVYGLAEPDGRGRFDYMIRLCIELLEKCGKKLNNAKIVYLTDVPNPTTSDHFQAALQKANDLEGKEFEFHVIPMVDDFDYEPFYKEFITLSRAIEMDAFQIPDAQMLREILADRKLKQDFLRRCLGHFSFYLGPNLSMSVQYYNYFQRRAYPRKVQILRRDNSLVSTKRVIMVQKKDEESQEVLHEYQIKSTGGWYSCNVGGRNLRISTEQVNRVRNLHKPQMMLLGFKHRSSLPEVTYSKPSNFMYPDDQSIIGSKRLFRALWERCLAREKIAICLFMCKRKSMPRYVALVPVEAPNKEEEKNYRSLLCGDGFKIVYLPESKHIRNIDMYDWNDTGNSASDEGVEFFQKVIKKLRVDYQPNLINDPSLDALQANLLALSLDFTTDNKSIDNLLDTTQQDKRIEKLLPDYDKIFDPEMEPAKKRAAKSTTDGASAPKMPKIDEEQLKNLDYVKELIKIEKLTSCTVAQLNFILKEHFEVTMGKSTKAKLAERIEALIS